MIQTQTNDTAPMTQAQYRRLIERYDDMSRQLERIMQLVDELGQALGYLHRDTH